MSWEPKDTAWFALAIALCAIIGMLLGAVVYLATEVT